MARTLGQVFLEASRLAGYWRNQGTATAGTTTTLTDANNERTPISEANSVTGTYIYVYGGTSNGLAREIISYGTIGVFTWQQAGTAPDSTSTWVRVSRRPQEILDAIDAVTRRASILQAQPYSTRSLVSGSLLEHYGDMEEWANGTSSAPDGWTLGGTGAAVARYATLSGVGHGDYAAQLTPGTGVLTLTRDIPFEYIRNLGGAGVLLMGLVAGSAASDITVRVTTTSSTGTVANTDRANTYTGGRFQELESISTATITLPTIVAALTVQVRVAANASAAYVDDLVLHGGGAVYYQVIPTPLITVGDVIHLETGYHSDAYIPLVKYRDFKFEVGDNRRGIRFLRGIPSGRHIWIEKGLRSPNTVSAATSNVEPDPDWLALAAAVYLLETDRFLDKPGMARLSVLQKRLALLERSPVGNKVLGVAGL